MHRVHPLSSMTASATGSNFFIWAGDSRQIPRPINHESLLIHEHLHRRKSRAAAVRQDQRQRREKAPMPAPAPTTGNVTRGQLITGGEDASILLSRQTDQGNDRGGYMALPSQARYQGEGWDLLNNEEEEEEDDDVDLCWSGGLAIESCGEEYLFQCKEPPLLMASQATEESENLTRPFLWCTPPPTIRMRPQFGHTSGITRIRCNQKNDIFTSSKDGTIRKWGKLALLTEKTDSTMIERESTYILAGHQGWVNDFIVIDRGELSHYFDQVNNDILVSISQDQTLRIWDIYGDQVARVDHQNRLHACESIVMQRDITTGSGTTAAGVVYPEREARFFSVADWPGMRRREDSIEEDLGFGKGNSGGVDWDDDGASVYVAARGLSAPSGRTRRYRLPAVFPAACTVTKYHNDHITSIAGGYGRQSIICTGSSDGVLKVMDLDQLQEPILKLQYRSTLWNAVNDRWLRLPRRDPPVSRNYLFSNSPTSPLDAEHPLGIWSVAIDPLTRRVAAGFADGQLVLYDLRVPHTNQRRHPVLSIMAHNTTIRDIKLLSDNLALTASSDSAVKLWDLRHPSQHSPVFAFTDHVDSVLCLEVQEGDGGGGTLEANNRIQSSIGSSGSSATVPSVSDRTSLAPETPSCHRIYSGGRDGLVFTHNVVQPGFRESSLVASHTHAVTSMVASGPYLWTGTDGGLLTAWVPGESYIKSTPLTNYFFNLMQDHQAEQHMEQQLQKTNHRRLRSSVSRLAAEVSRTDGDSLRCVSGSNDDNESSTWSQSNAATIVTSPAGVATEDVGRPQALPVPSISFGGRPGGSDPAGLISPSHSWRGLDQLSPCASVPESMNKVPRPSVLLKLSWKSLLSVIPAIPAQRVRLLPSQQHCVAIHTDGSITYRDLVCNALLRQWPMGGSPSAVEEMIGPLPPVDPWMQCDAIFGYPRIKMDGETVRGGVTSLFAFYCGMEAHDPETMDVARAELQSRDNTVAVEAEVRSRCGGEPPVSPQKTTTAGAKATKISESAHSKMLPASSRFVWLPELWLWMLFRRVIEQHVGVENNILPIEDRKMQAEVRIMLHAAKKNPLWMSVGNDLRDSVTGFSTLLHRYINPRGLHILPGAYRELILCPTTAVVPSGSTKLAVILEAKNGQSRIPRNDVAVDRFSPLKAIIAGIYDQLVQTYPHQYNPNNNPRNHIALFHHQKQLDPNEPLGFVALRHYEVWPPPRRASPLILKYGTPECGTPESQKNDCDNNTSAALNREAASAIISGGSIILPSLKKSHWFSRNKRGGGIT